MLFLQDHIVQQTAKPNNQRKSKWNLLKNLRKIEGKRSCMVLKIHLKPTTHLSQGLLTNGATEKQVIHILLTNKTHRTDCVSRTSQNSSFA